MAPHSWTLPGDWESMISRYTPPSRAPAKRARGPGDCLRERRRGSGRDAVDLVVGPAGADIMIIGLLLLGRYLLASEERW